MRKQLPLILVVAMLLTGCSNKTENININNTTNLDQPSNKTEDVNTSEAEIIPESNVSGNIPYLLPSEQYDSGIYTYNVKLSDKYTLDETKVLNQPSENDDIGTIENIENIENIEGSETQPEFIIIDSDNIENNIIVIDNIDNIENNIIVIDNETPEIDTVKINYIDDLYNMLIDKIYINGIALLSSSETITNNGSKSTQTYLSELKRSLENIELCDSLIKNNLTDNTDITTLWDNINPKLVEFRNNLVNVGTNDYINNNYVKLDTETIKSIKELGVVLNHIKLEGGGDNVW